MGLKGYRNGIWMEIWDVPTLIREYLEQKQLEGSIAYAASVFHGPFFGTTKHVTVYSVNKILPLGDYSQSREEMHTLSFFWVHVRVSHKVTILVSHRLFFLTLRSHISHLCHTALWLLREGQVFLNLQMLRGPLVLQRIGAQIFALADHLMLLPVSSHFSLLSINDRLICWLHKFSLLQLLLTVPQVRIASLRKLEKGLVKNLRPC